MLDEFVFTYYEAGSYSRQILARNGFFKFPALWTRAAIAKINEYCSMA